MCESTELQKGSNPTSATCTEPLGERKNVSRRRQTSRIKTWVTSNTHAKHCPRGPHNTDPCRTSEAGLRWLEIHVHHGGGKPRNNMEGTSRRILRRSTMTKYHERFYMERSEGSRNESSPHSGRTEAKRGWSKYWNNIANQILEAETGCHIVLTTHQNEWGHIEIWCVLLPLNVFLVRRKEK